MGLFSNWFKGRKYDTAASSAEPITYARLPERNIRYDPGLVDSLKHDHTELVSMYGQLGQDVKDGQFQRIPNALLAFKTRLEAHLLIENVRFYVYLEQAIAGDSDNMALIRDFRREMNTIARGVVEFVRRYQQTRVTPENSLNFIREYDEVGKLLVMRIEREEGNLYPLYAP
ncbi:hemerythrin domain-containing protein [Agrilutibacter solisilvae]|uniref:Hemerythrin domain-containing protein n=1 Tax=Agrilutibacter solisilvae TaxID=2763317 RepID=A0A975ASN9_9GAMM|nr:hemerythrin domain-containing protein [Lysobacter solisilvae]QSX78264.1 hemerythrin domain-containing protein [Lysobacter solisilvae]